MSKKRWPIAVVAAYLVALGLGLIPLFSFTIDNRIELWVDEGDPGVRAYDEQLEIFGEWNFVLVGIEAFGGIYEAPFLEELERATEQIEALPHVRKVISLANARTSVDESGVLDYRELLGPAPWTKDQLAEFRRTIGSSPIYLNAILQEENTSTTVLLIHDESRLGDADPSRIQLLEGIDRILGSLNTVKRHAVVGSTTINAETNRSSQRDLFRFVPLTSALILIFAWIVFRRVVDVVVLVTPVLGAIVFSSGLMIARGHGFTATTAIMPAIILSLGVAGAVHLIALIRLGETEVNAGGASENLPWAAARRLLIPVAVAGTTTVIGFLSLSLTEIPPVRVFALYVALGIALAYALTLCVSPALLQILPAKPREGRERRSGLSSALMRIEPLWRAHPKAILGLLLSASTGAMLGLFYLEADTDYLELWDDGTRLHESYADLERWGYATSETTVWLRSEQAIQEPEVFYAIAELQREIERLPQVRKTIAPMDLLSEVERALMAPGEVERPMPRYERDGLEQLTLVAELSGNDDLTDVLASDSRNARILVLTDYLSGRPVSQLADQIAALAKQTLPQGVEATVTGLPLLWAGMDAELFFSQKRGIAVLSAAIFLILLLALRSLPLAAIGLAVNLIPIAMVLGIMGWLGVKINLATTLIAGVVMGISVDDTTHFLWRYRESAGDSEPNVAAIRRAMLHAGHPIVITSVLLAATFSSMVISDFRPTADFGLFTSMTIGLALVADVLALPCLLNVLDPLRLEQRSVLLDETRAARTRPHKEANYG